jgi:hypothetical protein
LRNEKACTAESNYIHSISKMTVECLGNCPSSFIGFPFNWVSETMAFDSYEYYAGCIKGSTKFLFSNISKDSRPIIQFQYKKGDINFDLSLRCKNRIISYTPGKQRNINTLDGPCPIGDMKPQCTNYFDSCCTTSG